MNLKDDFENDPVWDLLGKARPVEVSPFFARNVVREIRLAGQRPSEAPAVHAMPWSVLSLLRQWRVAIIGATAFSLAALVGNVLLDNRETGPTLLAHNPGDVEVIKHLDELLTYQDTTVWLDQSAY